MPIGGRLIGRLGSGIGLATEAYQHNKNKKANAGPGPDQATQHPQDDPDSSASEVDDDETTWALDEASQELAGQPPPYSEFDPATTGGNHHNGQTTTTTITNDKHLADTFLARHPPPAPQSLTPNDLPVPVIIPQRRPRDSQRGFVLAYAPILQDHGISQDTFLDFLHILNKANEQSQAFTAINLAAMGIGVVPSATAKIAAVSIRKAAAIGSESQSRVQRNSLLDKFNDNFFRPRKLWAMIVTWKSSSSSASSSQFPQAHTPLRSTLHNTFGQSHAPQAGHSPSGLSSSAGTTTGLIPIDSCAPLVYPNIDNAATNGTQIPSSKASKLKSSQAFIDSYLDRRYSAAFAGLHPDSALSMGPPPTQEFASRWADPNHPANSGTLLGLVTGGTYDPRARRRGQRAQRWARRGGHEMSEEEVRDVEMGRVDRRGKVNEQKASRERVPRTGQRMGVRRLLKPDVVYLMIVALPENEVM